MPVVRARYDADPENVALIGHSSGAHLTSLFLAQEQLVRRRVLPRVSRTKIAAKQNVSRLPRTEVLAMTSCQQLHSARRSAYQRAITVRACILISGIYDLHEWVARIHPPGTYFHDLALHALIPSPAGIGFRDGQDATTQRLLAAASPCGCLAETWRTHVVNGCLDQQAHHALLRLPPCLLVHGHSGPFAFAPINR